MKVVIAAAGKGTRMGELTKHQPKHVIPILGKPFIYYLVSHLREAGYLDIVVVTGYQSDKIDHFLAGYNHNIKTVNQFKVLGDKVYGTACPVKAAKSFIGNENFILINGDALISKRDLKAFDIDDDYCYLSSIESQKPEKYGVVISRGEYLERIDEKPERPSSNLVNCGFYKLTPDIFSELEKLEKSSRGEYEIVDAITSLAKQKKVKVKRIKDYWLDFGSPEDIDKVERFLTNKAAEKVYRLP
ncbi:NTP transferase domain-containing protein [Patescibacteria group bacterium]|nr:NTP transferase domain-containing protein [Patescibacteria group bacterium]